jgi:hypothetical protein
LKALLRLLTLLPLALIPEKKVYREKIKSNYLTLRFHLFQAPRVTKRGEV